VVSWFGQVTLDEAMDVRSHGCGESEMTSSSTSAVYG